jgi:hypothetical protein
LISNGAKSISTVDSQDFCSLSKRNDFQLVGHDSLAQEVYLNLTKGKNYTFIDHFALWNLLQILSRPDQSSPTSRFQVLLLVNDKTYYFDFFSESNDLQFCYFYGIEWVLKKMGSKRSLEYYASLIEGTKVKVNKDLEAFLVKNTNEIKNNPLLSQFYFRGADLLKENETIPPINIKNLIKYYRDHYSQQKIIVNSTLNSFLTTKGASGNCNYDFNLYDHSIYLIDQVIPSAHLYGLSFEKNSFMAVTSQKFQSITPLLGQPIFEGISKVRSSAICVMENGQQKIWTISNSSRDPGQHLFHLIRYGLPRSRNTNDVHRLIRHSRHLFLSDPVRLIIESARSSPEQVENLLKLNLPIYNAEKLGNIWAFVSFPDEGDRFIIDARNQGSLKCQ